MDFLYVWYLYISIDGFLHICLYVFMHSCVLSTCVETHGENRKFQDCSCIRLEFYAGSVLVQHHGIMLAVIKIICFTGCFSL